MCSVNSSFTNEAMRLSGIYNSTSANLQVGKADPVPAQVLKPLNANQIFQAQQFAA